VLKNKVRKDRNLRRGAHSFPHGLFEKQNGPADEVDQSIFKIVPVPLDFCVQLKLLYCLSVADVAGDCVAQSVRMSSNKAPSVMGVVMYV
jgi:hypothetical protein